MLDWGVAGESDVVLPKPLRSCLRSGNVRVLQPLGRKGSCRERMVRLWGEGKRNGRDANGTGLIGMSLVVFKVCSECQD